MNDHSDPSKIKIVTQQVEAAIKSGQIDSELQSSKEARQAAIKAIVEAERVDPRKLRRPVTI